MDPADELYGLYVLYFGLPYSSHISSKPAAYLESCAKSLLLSPSESILSSGVKSGESISTSLPSFTFDEKFMRLIEKHLINIEEEVPDIKPVYSIKIEPKKKQKKIRFNDSVHKKSIIVEHMKMFQDSFSSLEDDKKYSYSVYKRKPRD